jgi:hypothetical protein
MNFSDSPLEHSTPLGKIVKRKTVAKTGKYFVSLLTLLTLATQPLAETSKVDAGDIASYVKLLNKSTSSVAVGDTKTITWKFSTRKRNGMIEIDITSDQGIRIEKGYSNFSLPLDENRVYEVPVKITATGEGPQNIYFKVSDVSTGDKAHVGSMSMTVTVKNAG